MRHLVFPLSNLLATHQIHLGDLVTVGFDPAVSKLIFLRDRQGALVGTVESQDEKEAMVRVVSHRAGASRALARRAPRG